VTTATLFVNIGGPIFPGIFPFSVNTGTFPNPNFSDFMFGGQEAVGGTVTACPSSGDCAVTPLPAALPLFGTGLLALASFAAWSRRTARG
jgi:hypothetical protein